MQGRFSVPLVASSTAWAQIRYLGFAGAPANFPLSQQPLFRRAKQLMKTPRWWNSTEAKNSTEQLNSVEAREGKQLALWNSSGQIAFKQLELTAPPVLTHPTSYSPTHPPIHLHGRRVRRPEDRHRAGTGSRCLARQLEKT